MRRISRLLAALALGLPAICLAGPSDYVYVPSVEYGEREIDFKLGTEKAKSSEGGERESAASLGFGYGATEWWFTEAYLKYEKHPAERTKYDAFEWENRFQLTESNRYWVDAGLVAEVEIPRERREEGYEFKWGALFQFDTGDVRWNANVLFERAYRSHEAGEHPMEIGYQLQAKVPLGAALEVGAQAFGEMGKWNHWDPREEQSHKIGPALFGKVRLGGREAIRYNAAWLAGSNAAPRRTFRLQAEYEF